MGFITNIFAGRRESTGRISRRHTLFAIAAHATASLRDAPAPRETPRREGKKSHSDQSPAGTLN